MIQAEIVTYNGLADEFFVSSSSIKKDLEEIKSKLDNHTEVRLVSDNHGTKIQGTEIEIREAMVWFNHDIITNNSNIEKNNVERVKEILRRYYGESVVNTAYDILYNFVLNNNSLLSDYYIFNTLNVYIVQVFRLILNKSISQPIKEIVESNFANLEDYNSGANQLLSRASARLSFEYNDFEIIFLTKYLILNRFEQLPDEASNNEFIERLILHLSEALSVDFTKDKKLLKELKQHVPPMIYRLRLGVHVDNPFVSQIKNEYPQTFHTIMLVLSKFETDYQLNFNDDEIALLTIYFQSAIENQRLNRKVLVVCQYGLATSELLVNRLKNELGSRDSIESAAVGELKYFNLDEYDLIISSTEIIKGNNVINVSPFLSHQDIEVIKSRLNNASQSNALVESELRNILQFLNTNYIIEEGYFESREDLLKSIGDKLIKDGFIKEGYIASVIHRESLGNTDLPDGIATPHGDVNFVNKSLVVVVNNKEKIRWNRYYVDKIFILLINKEDTMKTKELIKELYALINNRKIMKNFKEYLITVKGELEGGN
ncbi:BglG family transcription antiterminator [Aerococcaceae bacterium WGS1372]